MNTPRVAIIGGGITGLTLAFTLQEDARHAGAPLSITVLEAGPRIGGHARTVTDDGFLVETGPNGFLNREPHTLALTEALGLGRRLIEARPEAKRRFILRNGRLCLAPDSPRTLLTSASLSWRGKLRLLAEPFAPGPPPETDETIFGFAARRIGREAAEMLVDTAVSGISAGDSRHLSVAAQFPRMVEMEREHGSLIAAMLTRRRTGLGAPKLLSFDNGLGTLIAALGERLAPSIRTDSRVASIERVTDAWRLVTSGGQRLEADHVVLAAPARAAAPIVEALDLILAGLLESIQYAGIAMVGLGYRAADVARPLDGYGYLVTRPENLATLGVVWESSLFSGRAPEGMVLLRVFLGGSRRPGVLALDSSQLAELARHELAHIMGISAFPMRSWTFLWPGAIAQYTVGHLDRRARISERVGRYPGLHVCGTSYDGVSFNDAVKSGRLLARSLAEVLRGRSTGAERETAAVGA